VAHPALGDKSKIYLSPLHIMLGLIKISVKTTDKENENLPISGKYFPIISVTRKKKGILVGSQITQLFEEQEFNTELNSAERRAWKAF